MKDEEKRGRKEGEKKKGIVGQPCFDAQWERRMKKLEKKKILY